MKKDWMIETLDGYSTTLSASNVGILCKVIALNTRTTRIVFVNSTRQSENIFTMTVCEK
jgi:hypothetical protein